MPRLIESGKARRAMRASSRFGPVNQMTACEPSGAVLDDADIFASGGMSLWVDMVERRPVDAADRCWLAWVLN